MAVSVLIVDDHAAFRRRARQLLEVEGLDVVGEAATGEAGIRCAADLRPDVALLDVHLPDRLGFDLVHAFPVPVILISTHDESTYPAMAVAAGARGFILKDAIARSTVERLLR